MGLMLSHASYTTVVVGCILTLLKYLSYYAHVCSNIGKFFDDVSDQARDTNCVDRGAALPKSRMASWVLVMGLAIFTPKYFPELGLPLRHKLRLTQA